MFRTSWLLSLLALVTACAGESHAQLVISQIYSGGGSAQPAAAYKRDYIEILNTGSGSASLAGLSLQYGSGTGNFASGLGSLYVLDGSVSLAAGARYTVVTGNAGTAGADNPAVSGSVGASDANISLAAANGKIALVNSTTSLNIGGATQAGDVNGNPAYANVIDLVGYGTANTYETRAAGTPAGLDSSIYRLGGGAIDTNNNFADFFTAQAVQFSPVPEPATALGLAAAGLGALRLARRRVLG